MPIPNWRVRPDAATAYAVEQMAKKESRSVSSMLMVLIRESIGARRKADGTINRLVAALRAQAPEAAS